jgi:Zn finger protein HypA/HybF involved in hydrogenase expression
VKIRTRYKLFKAIIVLAVVVFLVSLWDIFGNDSDLFEEIMLAYIVLGVLALILYIGHKPDLDEEPVVLATPEPMPEQDVVAEVTPGLEVQGPHHFRCPFCSNVFALELTHLQKRHETRMDCPFCANTIRIPSRPKLAPGEPVAMDSISAAEQAVFVCSNCGEIIRYSAPGQRAEERARVHTCPHCGSDRVSSAAGAAA